MFASPPFGSGRAIGLLFVRICNPHGWNIGIYNPAITSFVAPANAGIRCRRISNPPEHYHGQSIVFACPCRRKISLRPFPRKVHFSTLSAGCGIDLCQEIRGKSKKADPKYSANSQIVIHLRATRIGPQWERRVVLCIEGTFSNVCCCARRISQIRIITADRWQPKRPRGAHCI